MPITLGTRSRANIRFGPAQVYIAEGGTLSVPTSFSEGITPSALTTLLSSFSYLGNLEENPKIESEPLPLELIDGTDAEISYEVHHRDEIRCELKVAELDSTIANILVSRYEAGDKTDFLWLRGTSIGEYINFICNVPFLLTLQKNHSWGDIEKMIVRLRVMTFEIKKVHFQKFITDEA